MNIYLIRHARQSSPLCNVNVDLAAEGITQAKILAERLKDYKFDALYSSQLIRAVQTAEYINEYHHLEHNIREALQEIDFGDLTGLSNDEILRKYTNFSKNYKKMKEDIRYPGGENGQDTYNRAFPVIEEILASGHENVLVVTHGGVIRSLLAGLFTDNMAYKAAFGASLENTSITQICYKKEEKQFYLQKFNDYSHLEAYPELLKLNWKK